jgi:hypothetical protein
LSFLPLALFSVSFSLSLSLSLSLSNSRLPMSTCCGGNLPKRPFSFRTRLELVRLIHE